MATQHVLMANFQGNPNVGLYAFCTDKYCLVGNSVPKKMIPEIEAVLKVPVYQLNIAGTSLLGVFCSGNSRCLLLPPIVFDEELQVLDRHGITYKVISTNLTALGNNMLCNDNGCVVSPEMEEKAVKQIEAALGVQVTTATIATLDNVGSLASVHSTKGLISIDAEDGEIKLIESVLKIKLTKGTMGMGVPYVSSSITVNTNGFVVSDHSSGIEIADADEAFGFLD
jgi:translation initiation factor 6